MTGFSGRVALVTGAARGMGRTHCVRFAQEGADVLAIDLDASAEELAGTQADVAATGQRCVVAHADVRDRSSMSRAVQYGVSQLGRLDVVVANAGIYSADAPSWETPVETWQRTIDINLTGVWNTVKVTLDQLTHPGAAIVIVSSANGLKGTANSSAYTSSKHAVVGLARTLANELGPEGIRVNTVHPGAVNTEMTVNQRVFSRLRPDLEHPRAADISAAMAARNLLPVPWVEPVDVSNAVLFLCSEEARYITGSQLVVDAGLTQKV